VVEDLHDVRAAELRRRLRLALEAHRRLGVLRDLALDELHRAWHVEAAVAGLPHGAHASATDHAVELEPASDELS